MFLGKDVLKIYSKFTEHSYRSAISIKMLCNFIEITLRHGCSPVTLLYIFKTLISKNTNGGLLLSSRLFICTFHPTGLFLYPRLPQILFGPFLNILSQLSWWMCLIAFLTLSLIWISLILIVLVMKFIECPQNNFAYQGISFQKFQDLERVKLINYSCTVVANRLTW